MILRDSCLKMPRFYVWIYLSATVRASYSSCDEQAHVTLLYQQYFDVLLCTKSHLWTHDSFYSFRIPICFNRVLEMKNEMVQLEFSEFHYFDDVLSDLKLTPVSLKHYVIWNLCYLWNKLSIVKILNPRGLVRVRGTPWLNIDCYGHEFIWVALIHSVHFFCSQDDIEVPIPKYFIYENSKELQEREKLLGGILAKMGPQEAHAVSIWWVMSLAYSYW